VAADKLSTTFTSGGGGRAFQGYTEAVEVGFYVMSVRVSNCVGTFTNQNISVTAAGATITGTLNAVNGNHNGRLAVWFECTGAGNVTTRYGLGLPSNEASGVSLTISEYMFEKVAAINTVPSEFVPPGQRAAFSTELANTVSSGKYIDETIGATIPYCVVDAVFIQSDSFGNETSEYPFLLKADTAHAIYTDGIGGRTLVGATTDLDAAYNLTNARFVASSSTGNTVAADWASTTALAQVIINEHCINDILIESASIAVLEARTRAYVAEVRRVAPNARLIMFNASPCSASASWSAGKQILIDAYNALMITLATELEFTLYDRYAALAEPGVPEKLRTTAPGYDSGDGLHPGPGGSQKMATDLAPIIQAEMDAYAATVGFNLGDDSNDGLSKFEPWLTETFALSETVEGDIISFGPGTYGILELEREATFTRGADGLIPMASSGGSGGTFIQAAPGIFIAA
jgi:lysophospholipase L1-like esterase